MDIILITILESFGVKFITSESSHILCEYKGLKFKYFLNGYKIYGYDNPNTIDFYDQIRKHKDFKQAHKIDSQKKLKELMTRDSDDFYDIVVNTQVLDKHEKDVTNFLDNYDLLKIKSALNLL